MPIDTRTSRWSDVGVRQYGFVTRQIVRVRHATGDDLTAVYDVCLRTGAAGADATAMVRDGALFGHLYAGPYVVLEPALAFVAEVDGTVVGYVVGALDTAQFEARCHSEWWPDLQRRHPLPAVGTELDRRLVGAIHHPHRTDARLAERYPSHLHINLLPAAQGGGGGRLLMATIVQHLIDAGSTGVHLGVDTRNTRAMGFYEHLGFRRHDHPTGVLFTRSFARTST